MEKYIQYRFLSRIVIEAKSPLQIGSGNKSIKTDALLNRDVNGYPFIPGTTIAGLLRHAMNKDKADKLMGFQTSQIGEGSLLIVSEAKMLGVDGTVMDGIVNSQDEVTLEMKQLPIRQHAKIDHKGVTEKAGKFDEEVILVGTRFCFELEMLSETGDDTEFKGIIDSINTDTFRIGGGSRNGYGAIEVCECKYRKIDLQKDMQEYLSKSSSLTDEWSGYNETYNPIKNEDDNYVKYELKLQPEDFVLFGSGLGSDQADMTYVRERIIKWKNNKPNIIEQKKVLLVPASSVKGALSHRTAYHYNKLEGSCFGKISNEDIGNHVGTNNKAVKNLFGSEGCKDEKGKTKDKKRGNVIISDFMKETAIPKPKILNHVAIDRFTGGAIDGALFSEETLYTKNEELDMIILVSKNAFIEKNIQFAIENALLDICNGLLPLGGGVNRGNGCFCGKLLKNGEEINEYNR